MLGAWWGTEQLELPFPTATMGGQRYKVYGVVTNRQDMPGPELIHWHRERCGRSEHAHAIMKSDLAGGKLPSALFGANAAWWAIMILALNLDAALKALVLGPAWRSRRLKAMRFRLINLPARLVRPAGRLTFRIARGAALQLITAVRTRILSLARGPTK